MTCARGVCRLYREQYQTLSFHEYQEGVGWTEFLVDLVCQLTKFVTCRNILPYYRKAQSHQEGESTYRGGGGFWWLGRFRVDSGRQVDPNFWPRNFPKMTGSMWHSTDFYKMSVSSKNWTLRISYQFWCLWKVQ